MPRLFIGEREHQFVNDIIKEYVKDIVGQSIFYYPVSIAKTQVDPVYNEGENKVFDNPIKVDALVSEEKFEPVNDVFGAEYVVTLEVFLQYQDLIDKNIQVSEGDFFVYAGQAYEITSQVQMGDQFGAPEHVMGYKLTGRNARQTQVDPETGLLPISLLSGPLEQNGGLGTWQQQRGLQENIDGPTGDVREMRRRLGDDMSEPALGEGPRTVSREPDPKDPLAEEASSFYNE